MMKLIYFELKKIFKNKVNVALLLLVLGMSGFMVVNQTTTMYQGYQSLDGQAMSSIEVIRFMDNYAHENAGKITPEYVEQLKEKQTAMIQEYGLDDIDEERMAAVYGKEWKTFIQAGIEGTLSKSEFDQYMKDNHIVAYVPYNEKNGTFRVNTYYKNEKAFELLSWSMDMTFIEAMASVEDHLMTKENLPSAQGSQMNLLSKSHYSADTIKGHEEEVLAFENQRIHEVKPYMDTTQSGQLLERFFTNDSMVFVFLLLLLLTILYCSQIFAKERENKMEQMLACTKKGSKQSTIAKIITAFLVTLVPYILMVVGIFIFVAMIVPIRNLDLVANFHSVLLPTKKILIYAIALQVTALLGCALTTLFLSCSTKNRVASVIPMFIMNALPLMLTMSNIEIFKYVPLHMMYTQSYMNGEVGGFVSSYNLIEMNGTLYPKIFIYVGIWLILMVVMVVVCWLKQKRHIVK